MIENKFAIPAESRYGKYIFCYFVGNEPENERIHLAVSEDGYHFYALNKNEAVILQKDGTKCVRDPYIIRGQDGTSYIIATDMKSSDGWTSNHALVTWKSKDLIHWTDETIIDIRKFGEGFENTDRAWAPQAVWDDNKKAFMVYWANSTLENEIAAIYYAYTNDFKSMTKPEFLYAHSDIQTIDADIVYNEKDKKYYLYFKHDEDQTIAYVTSDKLTGLYLDNPVVISLAPSGVEGSEMYNIAGTDTWIMIMDEYSKGRFFAQQTVDFKNFLPLDSKSFTMEINPRHGSVMQITDEEYNALISEYGVEK